MPGPPEEENVMLTSQRRLWTLVALASLGVAVIAHRVMAQTPVLTTGEVFKESVTLLSSAAGVKAKDPTATLYTVPSKRVLVVTSILLANDQDSFTDVILRENSGRKTAVLRVPPNSTICCELPTGLPFDAESKVGIENLGGPGGQALGNLHVTLNGYLRKIGTAPL
jgi:hypothetical protein